MLTTGEAISASLKYSVNQGSASVDTDQSLRDRAHYNLTVICGKIRARAPLWWLYGSGTVSQLAADLSSDMPADFGSMGQQGNVYISGQNLPPLGYLEPQVLDDLRAEIPRTGRPEAWTLSGKSAQGLSQIKTYPIPDVAYTLNVTSYVRRRPDLIDRPGELTAAVGSATGLTGVYRWRVTFATAAGETEGGVVSSALTLTNQKASLSAIPISPERSVSARNLYRTEAGGEEYLLVAVIADNTTTVYVDNIADGSLGASCPTPAAATTGLEVYPPDFHETVIVEGLNALMARRSGDVRDKAWLEEFDAEVRRMWANEKQGQNGVQAMPIYGSGVSGGGRRLRLLPG